MFNSKAIDSKFNFSVRLLILAIIILGIFFRFANLDRKIFWSDEIFTALRASGQTGKATIPLIYTRQNLSFSEIEQYIKPLPGTDMTDVIQGAAKEEPHLPPLHFVLVRAWVDLWGSTSTSIRSLSAVMGVLALPAMYWLAMELFGNRLTAWIGVALVAISPLHIVYSQEARTYSLWTLLIMVSGAMLLRSLKRSTPLNWFLYALTVALGLYTHLFFALVTLAHGLYVLIIERFNRKLVAYILASIGGVLTFSPWLLMLISNVGEAEKMVVNTTIWKMRFSLASMMSMWLGNNSRIFFDVGVGSSDSRSAMLMLIPIILICLFLSVYSIYFLVRNSHLKTWLFAVTLIVVPGLAYIASDIINGGRFRGFLAILFHCILRFN
jgi:uncharacterized membrane protein